MTDILIAKAESLISDAVAAGLSVDAHPERSDDEPWNAEPIRAYLGREANDRAYLVLEGWQAFAWIPLEPAPEDSKFPFAVAGGVQYESIEGAVRAWREPAEEPSEDLATIAVSWAPGWVDADGYPERDERPHVAVYMMHADTDNPDRVLGLIAEWHDSEPAPPAFTDMSGEWLETPLEARTLREAVAEVDRRWPVQTPKPSES